MSLDVAAARATASSPELPQTVTGVTPADRMLGTDTATEAWQRPNGDGPEADRHAGGGDGRRSARQKSAGNVALLDIHLALADALRPDQRRAARRALIVPAIQVENGRWDPAACTDDARVIGPVIGVQVLAGILVREVVLGYRAAAQIYGPGDLIHVPDTRADRSLPVISTVLVSGRAVLAVLDDRVLVAARRWPRLAGSLLAQAMRQVDGAGHHQAISQLARVEERLLALFWHLADRWGRVGSDGIAIDLSLTHETVGHLVGARRSTVTLGLSRLRDQQLLRRDPDGVWLLAPASLQRLNNPQADALARRVPSVPLT
jgi:CRP-like cAMP-binding protein